MYYNILFFAFYISFFSFIHGENYLRGVKDMPTTVQEVEVDRYLGNWYQIYGSPTNVIFQGYGKCITAEYGVLENGNISVLNSQLNSKDDLEQISGYAYYKNVSEPGQLTVHLNGTPVDAPYWIVKLGEIMNDQYQYSIITTPSSISLWVLARDIKYFLENYDKEVIEFLEKYNYKYVTIKQDDTCRYV
jgi:lipocalin